MKRLIMTLIAGVSFAAATYATNTVSSANIVGYIQKDLSPGGYYVLVGTSFESDSGTPTLISIFGTNQLTQHFLAAGCDKVHIWDTVNQQYISVAQKSTDHNFYYLTNWSGTACSDLEIPLGSALWVQSAATTTETNILAISGNVPMDDSITNSIAGDAGRPLAFICNPYPTSKNINSLINTNDGATAHFLAAGADRIYLWDKNAQSYISLGLKSSDNKWHYVTNWTGAAAEINVDVGEGFWYGALNTFSWIENRDF